MGGVIGFSRSAAVVLPGSPGSAGAADSFSTPARIAASGVHGKKCLLGRPRGLLLVEGQPFPIAGLQDSAPGSPADRPC